jgi:hypothetical protein
VPRLKIRVSRIGADFELRLPQILVCLSIVSSSRISPHVRAVNPFLGSRFETDGECLTRPRGAKELASIKVTQPLLASLSCPFLCAVLTNEMEEILQPTLFE